LLVEQLEHVSFASVFYLCHFVRKKEKNHLVLILILTSWQALSLSKLAKKALKEDDAKALLEKRVVELEQANAQLKLELERSNEALATLQSSYNEEKKFCEGLTNRNFALRKEREDARSRAQVLEEEIVKVERTAAKNAAAAGQRYDAYCAKVKKGMASPRVAYELAVNGIGGLCLPIKDAASSSDDFFRLFESEVASLPEIFVGANENFVSIALEGVLHIVKQQNSVHFDMLQTVASTCEKAVFMSVPREVKKATQRMIKEWWRQHGFREAVLQQNLRRCSRESM
jgi:hypothetical protein